MKCVECDARKAGYDDPRDPPVEEGKCLCADCFLTCAAERCEDLEQESTQLRDEAATVRATIDMAKKKGWRK